MFHRIWLDKAYADAILSGERSEVRVNYKGYKKGDCVKFEVKGNRFHELRNRLYKITRLIGSPPGLVWLWVEEFDNN